MDSGSPIKGYAVASWSALRSFAGRLFRPGRSQHSRLRLLELPHPARLNDRNTLLAKLDRAARRVDRAGFSSWIGTTKMPTTCLLEPAARAAFDLTRETPATRARYGQSVFAKSALLARRLVEAGVPYIQAQLQPPP